jgi:hypothetical protein
MAFLIADRAHSDAMEFLAVSNGGNFPDSGWIVAEGEITAETPIRFQQFIEENRQYISPLMRIDAFGSDYDAAMELGRLFREHQFQITVGRTEPFDESPWFQRVDEGECVEACVLALVGGRERTVPRSTQVRVSQFHETQLRDVLTGGAEAGEAAVQQRVQRQAATGRIVQYLIEMGVDPRFYTHAASIDLAQGSQPLSPELLQDFGIDNTGDRAGPWRASPMGNGFVAEAVTRHTGRTVSIFCLRSGEYVLEFSLPNYTRWEFLNELVASRDGFVEIVLGPQLSEDSQRIPAPVRLISFEGDGSGFIQIGLDSESAYDVAMSGALTMWFSGSLSRGQYGNLFDFRFDEIVGGPELPLRTLRVCTS